jgi:hypothetical protein
LSLLEPIRPTIRCINEDLGIRKLPPATEPLDRLDHPVLKKAREVCRDDPPTSERIVSIDDKVLWKVKIGRWRGAVWCPSPRRWLIAAGTREAGSPDDFYADLAERGRRWRADHNRSTSPGVQTDTLVAPLLPTDADRQRLELERQTKVVDELFDVVPELVITAARSGTEQTDEAGGCRIGVLVRRTGLDDVYVAIRFVGPVQDNVTAVVLRAVPAVADPNGWFLDSMPGRASEPAELVWSNLLDPDLLESLVGA